MKNPLVRVIVLIIAIVVFWQLGMLYSDKKISKQQSEKKIKIEIPDRVVTIKVNKGDTIEQIANFFGVSVDTIKWENNLTDNTLTPGQALRIPPVTGVVHTIAEGDTLEGIAKKYKTTVERIVKFPPNKVSSDKDLVVGNVLYAVAGIKE